MQTRTPHTHHMSSEPWTALGQRPGAAQKSDSDSRMSRSSAEEGSGNGRGPWGEDTSRVPTAMSSASSIMPPTPSTSRQGSSVSGRGARAPISKEEEREMLVVLRKVPLVEGWKVYLSR